MRGLATKLGWALLAIVGAFCLGTVALHRGETINATWLVVASVSVLMIGYRFYSRFIAEVAAAVRRALPAARSRASLCRAIAPEAQVSSRPPPSQRK